MVFSRALAIRTCASAFLVAASISAQAPAEAPASDEPFAPALPEGAEPPRPVDESPHEQPETLPVPPDPGPAAAAASAAVRPAGEPHDLDEPSTPGWFRADSDLSGLTLWAGATHDLGGVGLASNVYALSGAHQDLARRSVVPFSVAGIDIGPAFAFVDGAVAVTPMVGLQFDWIERRAVALAAPQAFVVVHVLPVYFESWVQCFFYGLFAHGSSVRDNLTTRNFLLYRLGSAVALGPHLELTYLFRDQRVASLPVGGAGMLNYGEHSTLLVALGYETEEEARERAGGSGERGLFGRFTFIQTW